MQRREVTVVNKLGLHARPAVLLVKIASQFKSDIKLIKEDVEVNAKSIMGVLILAAEQDSKLLIITDGSDEIEAIESIVKLFKDSFGEN